MAKRKYDHLNKEELVALLERRDRERKLGLVWERDEIEHEQALNDDFVALDLVPELSVGEGPYRNMIIEGDNFDALRYLRMTYANRVKCIYIDPPYNTGKRDFVYNDAFVEKDDAYRHSKWLETISRRLSLARELLREDGVIFISIADHEIFHLGLLMNQEFGEANKVGVIVWNNVTDNNPSRIAEEHEYILCYAKDVAHCAPVWKSADMAIKKLMSQVEERLLAEGLSKEELQRKYTAWLREHKAELSPLDRYKYIDAGGIYTGSQSVHNPGREGYRYDITHPITGKPCKQPLMGYRFPRESMDRLLHQGRILFGDDHTKLIELKVYLKDYKQKLSSVLSMDGRAGANELRALFDGASGVFNNPKPSALVEELLSYTTEGDDLVLDFYAGSGTTAHAIQALNAKDGGTRRFILVSNTEASSEEPQKNLCRDVCAKRVTKVGGRFSYLRIKRIPMEQLAISIAHPQIWLALQQLHAGVVSAMDPKESLHILEGVEADIVYLSAVDAPTLKRLAQRASASAKPCVIYSWQPGLVAQRVHSEHVDIRPIPEFLLAKFGGAK